MPRNPHCSLCELHLSSKHVCIWGTGGGEGFVVGEAPGREEGRTGKPFMGKAGLFGRPILAEHGIVDPYITNAAKCRPPDNRKPEPSELKACKPYLLEEIEKRNPKAILLWGATAMRALIGKTGVTEMNGQVVEKEGRTYVCCFHPAYVLRDPSKEGAFRMAVSRYAAVLGGTHSLELPPWRAVYRESIDEFIEDWVKADNISFDVETTGLDWWRADFKINTIQFSMSNEKRTWEKNWGLPLAKAPVLPFEAQKELLHVLAGATGSKKISGQFAKFDNLCLRAVYGVEFHQDDDTGLAHHLVDENNSHELKVLARQFLGAPDYDLPLKEKLGNTSIKKLLTYGCADSAYTSRLVPIFKKKMDIDERWLYDHVIMPASRAFQDIESNGLYVDLEHFDRQEKEKNARLHELVKLLNKAAKKEVNWNSPSQVAEILYGKLGLEPTVFTEKGKPSTNEEALLDIDHPIADLLTEYRENEKFLSTYIGKKQPDGTYEGGLREFMIGPHLYINTKIHGTVTGRYSSRLHSIPRDGSVRNGIIAPPGWDHVQLDLSQAELKTIAIIAREPEMLKCFKEGRDIHWRTLMAAVSAGGGEYVDTVFKTAKLLTKKKLEFPDALQLVSDLGPDAAIELISDWKEGRKKAKGINFGFPYSQQPSGFIHYAKMKFGFTPTLREATQFHDLFFDLYRALPAWHERQKKLVHKDGFVRSMSGRKRRLPGIYSSDRQLVAEAERQAINSPIQGFIGDYKAMILVELHEALPREHLRITMEHHDAILMWTKKEHTQALLPRIKAIGDNPKLARECGLSFPIPLTVDLEVGPWGAGKRWKGE